MSVAAEDGFRKIFVELAEQGDGICRATALLLGTCQIVGDVITGLASVWLGVIESVDRPGKLSIQEIGVPSGQPCQRAGVFGAVLARIGFNSRVGSRGAVLQ